MVYNSVVILFIFLVINYNNSLSLKVDDNTFNPEELVNILGGTDSRYDISHGSTLPLITRPWGYNNYAPQTDNDPTWPGWWFHPSDRRFFGLRVTHQPSPWIGDYGNFLIKASIPSSVSMSKTRDQFTGISPKQSVFSPYYFKTTLLAYGTESETSTYEFSPSSHGGIVRLTFPSFVSRVNNDIVGFRQTRRISIILNGDKDYSQVGTNPLDGTAMISGYTKANSDGVGSDDAAFAHYFVVLIYSGEDGNKPVQFDEHNSKYDSESAWIDFDAENENHKKLTVRFATSFISTTQAMQNLMSEVGVDKCKSFDTLRAEAKADWHRVLSRVKVFPMSSEDTGYSDQEIMNMNTIFYSSLYRSSLFPRQLSEVTATGDIVHWSPYANGNNTNRVCSGPLSTDSGFWDAWNTVYPLLSLVNRPVLSTTISGWVNAYKEGGWLPKWASPGYRIGMVGTMGDVSLADAIVNEIPGFDVKLAYEAIRKDAFEIPPEKVDGVGRVCLQNYLQYGYIPYGSPSTMGGSCSEIVSRTLNYLQSDYAIAQAALKLGYKDDYNTLMKRSANYNLIFNQENGFFRSKYDKGIWTEPFDQFAWGGDYTEGGPWQFRFYVPYDPSGLSLLYKDSGLDMCDELVKTQEMELSTFHVGGYDNEIHEQTELPDHCWGQYAHNNQPVHHMLYMFMYDGYGSDCASKGQHYIRKTLLQLYQPNSDMFPGDEDNGEMSAWYVLSSLGLYSLSPGSAVYTLGAPLFRRVEIDISDYSDGRNKTSLIIEANNNGKNNIYVQSVRWNGHPITTTVNSISYSSLKEGGILSFEMGPLPPTL